jgi:hypothetical protein
VTRRRSVVVTTGVVVFLVIAGAVIRNQVKVHFGRQARFALKQQQHPGGPQPPDVVEQRRALFDMLRPVALANCDMQRFGEAHDGGYLMCGNLLEAVEAAYSYGIGGYDDWGCDISRTLDVTVHQYDCFNTRRPACFFGDTVFHEACVGDRTETIDGRAFDTVANQLISNGDGTDRIVLKMDVEGAEWDSLLTLPDDVLARIDQLAVEFHWMEDANHRWAHDETYGLVVRRLRQFFEVANVHFNNTSCIGDLSPFPAFAYEVLFVSKRVAVVDRTRDVAAPHPLDAPNNSSLADCQPGSR